MEMVAVNTCDAAMAMAHVFAQANVGDCDQLRAFRLNSAQRFLNDSIFRISAAGLFVFMFWNSEQQDRLEAEIFSAARFIGNLFYGQLKNSRHTGNGPTFIQFFAYEQRQNKIVDTQLRLADKISQSWGTPQAPRAMYQSSHEADGTLAKLGRKQAAEAHQRNGVTRNRTNDGQMLDGMRRSVSASWSWCA